MIAAWSSVGATGTSGSGCFPLTRFKGAGFGDFSAGVGDAACLLPLAESSFLGVDLLFAAAAAALGLGFVAFSLAEGFLFFKASSSSGVACSAVCIVLYCTSGSFSKLRMFFRTHK